MNQNQKTLLFLLMLALSGAIVYFFTYRHYQEMNSLETTLEIAKGQLARVENFLQKRDKLISRYEEAKENETKMHYMIPESLDFEILLIQFNALATNNGLLLKNINCSDASPMVGSVSEKNSVAGNIAGEETEKNDLGEKEIKQSSCSIDLAGSYGALKAYLASLEKNVRIMDVKSIAFTSQAATSASSNQEIDENQDYFNYRVVLNLYHLN